MRIPINLASEPFRRDRPLIVASTVVSVLLLGLLTMLILLSISERNRAAEARASIETASQQLQRLTNEENRLQAIIRKPENAEVLERSVFENALIMRKGVSWTKIFADLETVVPHNVRIIMVRPQLNGPNDLILDMQVASQATEPVLNFLMQLEGSPLFGTTTIHNSLPPSQTDPSYRYRVSVNYAQKL
jgi:hypothetical protein